MLTVLDQNLEDAGWWKGDLNGKVGVFPDNFVEIIQEDEPPQTGVSNVSLSLSSLSFCITMVDLHSIVSF